MASTAAGVVAIATSTDGSVSVSRDGTVVTGTIIATTAVTASVAITTGIAAAGRTTVVITTKLVRL